MEELAFSWRLVFLKRKEGVGPLLLATCVELMLCHTRLGLQSILCESLGVGLGGSQGPVAIVGLGSQPGAGHFIGPGSFTT